MKKDRIVVVGSSNTDMIIKLDRIPKEGETLLGGEFSMAAGGKGANQAVGAARAGGQVTFVARVGQDMFGEQAVDGFKQDGIDVSYVFRDAKKPSGVALIFVAKDGENSIAVASGANAALAPSDIRKAKEALTSASTVVFQLETPLETVEAAAKLAKKAGARVILNPAPAAKLPATLLCCVSILTPNETEAELLTGIKVQDAESAGEAAKKLQALGVETVVITLGSKGAFYQDKDQQGLIPAFKVKAVDTTAAGDVFNGALAVGLTEGRELKQALRFASAAAAISVTRLGAQPSAPTRKEIEKFLKSH